MTKEETRQLGIEFERRIQTLIPETEFYRKLDTDTIYSFLNQFLDKYVNEIYRNLDALESGTKALAHVERVLLSMLTSIEVDISENSLAQSRVEDQNGLSIIDTARSTKYTLPADFYMYIRSVSRVTSTFSFRGGSNSKEKSIRIIPNQLMSLNDIWKMVETPHNSLRILRYPVAVLSQYNDLEKKPTLTVIYDQYTTPTGLKVLYYKRPKHFDLMTSTPCELPMEVFDDLVSGAVDLYVQYAAGAEARRRQLEEAEQKRAREDLRDARRSNNNNE